MLNNKFNFVLDNFETLSNVHYLNDMLYVSNSREYDVMICVRDLNWYKDKYALENISTIYNLDNNDSVIKVEKGKKKRKYKADDFPVVTLKKEAIYPKLESHPKFLFNLNNFVNKS